MITDAQGNPFHESVSDYVLQDVEDGTELPAIAVQSDRDAIFPALKRTTELYYEGEAVAQVSTSMEYTYDVYGNIIHYTDAGDGSDADRYEAIVTYHDNDANYIKSVPSSLEIASALGQMRFREQDIDSRGNILEVRKHLRPGETATTTFKFDAYGNILETLRPENEAGQRLAYTYEYDDVVHTYVLSVKDSYGYESSEVYEYKYGELLESVDINGQRMEFTIDARGRRTSIVGPNELEAGAEYALSFEYHHDAEVPYAITDRYNVYTDGNVRTIEYIDGLARTIQSKKDGYIHTGGGQSQPMTIISGTEDFDAFGRKVQLYYPVTEAPGNEQYSAVNDQVTPTRVSYDILDREIAYELPDGATTQTTYSILPDNIGVPRIAATTIDALGHIKVQFRDNRERVRAEMDEGPNGEIWTNYEFNPISELVEVIDNDNNITTYTYDNLGRRTSIIHPDAGTSTFAFDLVGNMTEKLTDKIIEDAENGGAVYYTYDYERLVQIDYPKNFQNKVQIHYGEPGADYNRAGRIWLREDASGGEEMFYNSLGEVSKSIRTVLISTAIAPTFVTEYEFDSWGRLRTLSYPDGERVDYTYDPAGKLLSVTGVKQNVEYQYLRNRNYDKFEEIVYQEYGNGTTSEFKFDQQRRWLSNITAKLPDGEVFQNNTVSYDAIGNITSVRNDAAPTDGLIGGSSEHAYTYDKLYRLVAAQGSWQGSTTTSSYSMDMGYDDLHNITSKVQEVITDDERDPYKSYNFEYSYQGPIPHGPDEVSGRSFTYDAAGNLLSTRGVTAFTFTQLLWDEENRLRGVSNNGYISQYTYDGNSERVIKSHGGQQGIFVDGAPAGSINHQDQYTAYVNPYFTFEKNRFVKHYFAGELRLLSKIGNGQFNTSLWPQGQVTAGDLNYSRRMQLLTQAQDNYFQALGVPPGPPTIQGYYPQPEVIGNPLPSGSGGQYSIPPANWPQQPGPPDPNGPPGPPVWYDNPASRDDIKAGYGFDGTSTDIFKEIDVFYYHTDHVGSSHYLTDFRGDVRQHTEYLPFGEVLIDQHSASESYRYKFNGKELDVETGYYYYGARYYDPRFSLWNSVDPLADQFPAWSPYAYVFHNPLKYTDPDGKAPGTLFSSPTKAALDFAKSYNAVSIEKNIEIGASIYTLTGDGKNFYAYSQPNFSTEEDGVTIPDAPGGFEVVADIHTHSAYSPEHDNDEFSPDDIEGNVIGQTIGYVATPKGRLLKYDPESDKVTTVSKKIPFDPKHPEIRGDRKRKRSGKKRTRTAKTTKKSNALHLGGSGKSARH